MAASFHSSTKSRLFSNSLSLLFEVNKLRVMKDLLSIAKEPVRTLKTKLDEAEKAVGNAEHDGYDVGVLKTEEALRA